MGTQLFKSFKRYHFKRSNLNSSKIYSNYSIMTGMKIAIIFMAIAAISVLANAVPLSYEVCEKKMKDCELTVGTKNEDGEWETVKKMDRECLQEVALECPELKIEFGSFGKEKRWLEMRIIVKKKSK